LQASYIYLNWLADGAAACQSIPNHPPRDFRVRKNVVDYGS